jgi:hypothetical protein
MFCRRTSKEREIRMFVNSLKLTDNRKRLALLTLLTFLSLC